MTEEYDPATAPGMDDCEIDDSKVSVGSSLPYYIGEACYLVKDAKVDIDDKGQRVFYLTLDLLSEVDTEEITYKKSFTLRYWIDQLSKDGGFIESNNNARATLRSLGKVKYGDQYVKVPFPAHMVGVMVVAETKKKKESIYPAIYSFTAPPESWLDGTVPQFCAEGHRVG